MSGEVAHSTVYCHDPGSRVLTANLEWLPVREVGVGTRLVTFDRGAPSRRRHRHFSTGAVTATRARVTSRVRVETSRGSAVVTPELEFLVRCAVKPRTRWVRAERLRTGQEIYFLPTWESDRTWEAGYLAGQFDGDGSLHFTASTAHSGASQLSWAQKAGRPCVSYLESVLAARGFKSRTHRHPTGACEQVHIAGDWINQMRFLGSVRPQRLLRHPELPRLWQARSLQACERAIVGEVVPLPPGTMVAVEVDTHTCITDGFFVLGSVVSPITCAEVTGRF